MKIGKFAKMHNLPISAVRHYINLGILMPERTDAQFNFRDQDNKDMEIFSILKNAGFTLKEISIYINTMRVYEPTDTSLYIQLLSLLRKKEIDLLHEAQQLQDQLKLTAELIKDCTKKYESKEKKNKYGIHVDFLDYFACPHCGGALLLENAVISQNHIKQGIFKCSCGYTSYINDGLLIADVNTNLDKDRQFITDYFGKDEESYNDFPTFDSLNNSTPEYLTIQYKAREWISSILAKTNNSGKVILFPDVASHFVYLYHDHPYFKDSLIIVAVPSKRIAKIFYDHLHTLESTLKIALVVSPNGILPFRNSCIDTMIDYLGSYSYSFFQSTPYISCVKKYLSSSCTIIGALDYFERNSHSYRAVKTNYPNSLQPMPDFKAYKQLLAKEGFIITDNEMIGSCNSSGDYYEYHIYGDPRYSHTYMAVKNRL